MNNASFVRPWTNPILTIPLRKSLLLIPLFLLITSLWVASTPTPRAQASAAISTNIPINGTSGGRTFDGFGGLSGGGGTSRLLIDYPAQQQKEILDYLFKPGYGANLQILKVEIGADTDTTNGAEASSQRTATDQNYNRGYEWWLMEQAKARNPNIKLYGLEWGAPGWFSGGFWSQDNINYITNWITHAQSDHNLHIDYIGGWNERNYNATWFENLHTALKSHNLKTQIVAADSSWSVATAMKNDATFNSAVDIVGTHYPCGWRSDGTTCNSTADAQSLNKPLWASENGSENYNSGANALARALNRDYIDGKMTADINWSVVASWYSTLPFYGDGLLLADQPWSGNYQVGKSIWVMAHTTQFAQPGWQYLDSATGYLGGNRTNGSYVTFKSPNGKDYSSVVETTNATSAQTATFQVTGGLSTGTAHVWATNLNSTNSSNYFVHQQDVTPSGGAFSLTLQPGYIYTISTTTGQGKGNTAPPASAALALPYTDNFEQYTPGQITHYFSDLSGAFESANCGGGRSGICLRQVITTAPIAWQTNPDPISLMGDPSWTNYQVSTDALLEQAGSVQLIGDINSQNQGNGAVAGYHLRVTNTGAWTLFKEDSSNNDTTLASGTTTFGINTWHTFSLKFTNGTIQAFNNGTSLTTVSDTTYNHGQIALSVSKWQNAQFDNVSIQPVSGGSFTPNPGAYYELVNRNSGKALDINANSTSNGALAIQYTYHGSNNQQWQFATAGSGAYKLVNRNSGKDLEDPGSSTTTGTQLDQSTDTNSSNQWWKLVSAGGGYYYLANQSNGLYADVNGKSTADGAAVIQWTSDGGTNQQWSIVQVG